MLTIFNAKLTFLVYAPRLDCFEGAVSLRLFFYSYSSLLSEMITFRGIQKVHQCPLTIPHTSYIYLHLCI